MATTITSVTLALQPEAGPMDVTFDDGWIVGLEPTGLAHHSDAVDGSGRFLLPGLIDTHLHLTGPHNLADLARAGVTTGIDLGTHPDSLVATLRDQRGLAAIVSAGSAASAPGSTQTTRMGFPQESVVRGPQDAERFVAWRADNGADLVKIIIEDPHNPTVGALSPQTLEAVVEAAHARGLQTVAHAVTAYSFQLGLDAGVDVLTHAPADRPLPDELVQRMVDAGTVASPTLVMMKAVIAGRAGQPGPALDYQACVDTVRALHAAGVPVIAGTDANETPIAPIPHGSSLHDELGLLVEAGLSIREALEAATGEAALRMRLADRGRIESGMRADLVLLDADPLLDLSAARTPSAVWVAGVPVDLGR